jgi:hypothetical protein
LSAQTWGYISGGLVILSGIPYIIRVYQGKIKPVPTSWSLWSFIGLALLLTYKSSGAEDNIWPVVFGFTNPTIIALLAIRQRNEWERLKPSDWACLIFGFISLIAWWFVRQRQELAQYALYLAMVADVCAWIPTAKFFKKNPSEDRPIPWLIFSIGYFLGIFAVPEQTFANYILPIYMTMGSFASTLLLAVPRIQHRISLKEWI